MILFSAMVTSTIFVLSFFFHFTFLSFLINIPLFFETYGWQRKNQASESYWLCFRYLLSIRPKGYHSHNTSKYTVNYLQTLIFVICLNKLLFYFVR